MKTESFDTLEVGRKYLSKDGRAEKICSNHSPIEYPTSYPFIGESGTTYTPAGTVWRFSKSDRDLISRIVEPTTLTIQRWGVVWKVGGKKGSLLINTLNTEVPITFKTRKDARRFAKGCPIKLKVAKLKCTYEVIE